MAELCYQLRYVEQKGISPNTMWAERQIGVYHRFEAMTADSDIMIVIRGAETRLTDTFKEGAYDLQSKTNPLLLHVLLVASCIDNWRWCLDSHAKECMDRVG